MIIGLVGFISSGKGTVSKILEGDYGYHKESMAKGLKDTVSILFGWPRDLLEGETPESRVWRENPDPYWSVKLGRDITPRHILQYFGTEIGRNMIHPDFWIFQIEKRLQYGKNYVISDIRFPNEIDLVNKLGGKIIRVKKGPEPDWYKSALSDNLTGSSLMAENFPDVHYSEWAWIGKEPDGTIENDGTLGDLKVKIDDICSKIT